MLGFNVPPTSKVIRRRDISFKSRPKDWRSPGSNLRQGKYHYITEAASQMLNPITCTLRMTEIRESKWFVHVEQKYSNRLYTNTHSLPLSPRFQDAQYVRTSTMLYRENPSGAGLNSSVGVEVNSSEYLAIKQL